MKLKVLLNKLNRQHFLLAKSEISSYSIPVICQIKQLCSSSIKCSHSRKRNSPKVVIATRGGSNNARLRPKGLLGN